MVIYFDESNYYKAIDKINQIVGVINHYNGVISNDDLQLLKSGKYYNQCWLNKLKEYCDNEYLDFDQVSANEYRINNPSINQRVTGMCRVNKEIERAIKDVAQYADYVLFDYIAIQNGKAVLVDNAYKLIKERFTHYTQNNNQSEITKLAKQMQEIYSKLESLGVARYKADRLVNKYDYNIIDWQLVQSF